ncbi:hypothetical protein JCM24511_08971 [Saitozyma sp. JCM 24511]|nr:hypothetical protein JCM24511_08971 [Saitozyma sp. JCM 24511]
MVEAKVIPESVPGPVHVEAVPYSAFSQSTRWRMVVLAGLSAICTTISSNIFVPAIPTLAGAFNRSEGDISQAVTVYLAFQAVTPPLFGAMSDSFGRRPLYLATLSVYCGATAGLACMPISQYWVLLFLRGLQSTGGSAIVAIGAGCVSDIAEPRERGKFMAVFQSGSMIGPALGPLLGGLLTQKLGWRAIFWFMTIVSGCLVVAVAFLQPESLRSLVSNGSVPPPLLNSTPQMLMAQRSSTWKLRTSSRQRDETRPPSRNKIVLSGLFSALLFVSIFCIITFLSTVLNNVYRLSELVIGLCYLPLGLGTILSSQVNGLMLDYYYQREERRTGGDFRAVPHEFRVDWVRLRCFLPFTAIFVVSSIALGWCLQYRVHLAVILVLNFWVGFGTGALATSVVYGQDVRPGKGSGVAGVNNFMRCCFGAIGTGTVQIMYNRLGPGWTTVIFALICLVGVSLIWIGVCYGHRWRAKREQKVAAGGGTE